MRKLRHGEVGGLVCVVYVLHLRAKYSPRGDWPASGGFGQLGFHVMLLFQATVHMEGGKITVEFPNYRQTSEIVGDKLVEVSVCWFLG